MRLRLHLNVEGVADIVARRHTHSKEYQQSVNQVEVLYSEESDSNGKEEMHI